MENRITIWNTSDPGVFPEDGHTDGNLHISPGVYAVTKPNPDAEYDYKKQENPLFTVGEEASEAFTKLAEAGQPDALVAELEGIDRVLDTGTFEGPIGPIWPGSKTDFVVGTSGLAYLWVAAMLIPSNDTVVATKWGIPLREGKVHAPTQANASGYLRLFNARTEPNAPLGHGEDQAPAQSDPHQGDDEEAPVRQANVIHDGVLMPDAVDVMQVTLEPN